MYGEWLANTEGGAQNGDGYIMMMTYSGIINEPVVIVQGTRVSTGTQNGRVPG